MINIDYIDKKEYKCKYFQDQLIKMKKSKLKSLKLYYNIIEGKIRKREYIYYEYGIILLKIISRTLGLGYYIRHYNECNCICGKEETIDHVSFECKEYMEIRKKYLKRFEDLGLININNYIELLKKNDLEINLILIEYTNKILIKRARILYPMQ